MSTPPTTLVIELRQKRALMEPVLQLHRLHRATLGFLPEAAFSEHSERGQLIVAVRDGVCLGYLMFRESRRFRRASIVHLCTDPKSRGQGITRLLLNGLKERTAHLDSIRLRCRRDFEAHHIWPKLGFQIIAEAAGRSRRGHPLVTWSLTQQELPLLRRLEEAERATRHVVAVDANVFFDFSDDGPTAEESKGLLADWLEEHVDVCITAELATEIDRKGDADLRAAARSRTRDFRKLTGTPDEFDRALEATTAHLGEPGSSQDESDRRQLARAIASGADYFATRDGEILKASDDLEDHLGIVVARPGEVVRRISMLLESSPYEPRRFEGSALKTRGPQPGADEEMRLVDTFLRRDNGEKKADFLCEIRRAISDPKNSRVIEIYDSHGDKSLLLAVRVARPDGSLEYTRLRLSRSRLAPTIARQYLTTELTHRDADVFIVSDSGASPEAVAAMEDTGFLSTGDVWIKAGRLTIGSSTSAVKWIEGQCDQVRPLSAHTRTLLSNGRAVEAERTLWPTKFDDLEIPSFVVPIRRAWAMQLFDTKLAEADLFGLPPELGFAFENAYYRAARPGIVRAPGRILWYVSGDIGAIRGCSYIDDVIVGPANDLFRRFRHLGIYRWEDIRGITRGDPTGDIMVIRFSGTELFEDPVSFNTAQDILQTHGRSRNQFASPVEIDTKLFGTIYSVGRKIKSAGTDL